ncbi:uncharacterized protein C2845_PM11G05900 [Panicum miliaceum]|uniref:CCHC-type domain-containing protein n=1 Tax=Panicum miliaceum TaxID=4540 RepID=A0A3L6RNB7_PANMI|nr:uncharacterized protein C2845_PM11G05900 [Panicum miliaceum]
MGWQWEVLLVLNLIMVQQASTQVMVVLVMGRLVVVRGIVARREELEEAEARDPVAAAPPGVSFEHGQSSNTIEVEVDTQMEMAEELDRDLENASAKRNKKDKDKWCFWCCTKGHVKEDCHGDLFCTICESDEHVAARCPMKKKQRPIAYAVDDLGFYHIPHGPIQTTKKDGNTALITVLGGQLKEEELIGHLKRLVPGKFEWDVQLHAPNVWIAPFLSKAELKRTTNFGSADLKDGKSLKFEMYEEEEYFGEEFPFIWMRVLNLPRMLRTYEAARKEDNGDDSANQQKDKSNEESNKKLKGVQDSQLPEGGLDASRDNNMQADGMVEDWEEDDLLDEEWVVKETEEGGVSVEEGANVLQWKANEDFVVNDAPASYISGGGQGSDNGRADKLQAYVASDALAPCVGGGGQEGDEVQVVDPIEAPADGAIDDEHIALADRAVDDGDHLVPADKVVDGMRIASSAAAATASLPVHSGVIMVAPELGGVMVAGNLVALEAVDDGQASNSTEPSLALGSLLERAINELKESKGKAKFLGVNDCMGENLVSTPVKSITCVNVAPTMLRRSLRRQHSVDEDSTERASRAVAKRNLEDTEGLMQDFLSARRIWAGSSQDGYTIQKINLLIDGHDVVTMDTVEHPPIA